MTRGSCCSFILYLSASLLAVVPLAAARCQAPPREPNPNLPPAILQFGRIHAGLSSGSMIIQDNRTRGAMTITAGMNKSEFLRAAKRAKIGFELISDDEIRLCDAFGANVLYFKGGKFESYDWCMACQ
jgi:hypothetical protein